MFRQFDEEYKEMDAVELLAEYGIYQTPDFVYFKGDVRLLVEGEEMNLSLLKQGIGISGEDIENIQIFLKKDSVFFLQTMLWFSSCIPVNFINLIRIHPNLLYEMSLLMVLPDYSYHIFIFQCIHQNMNFFIF